MELSQEIQDKAYEIALEKGSEEGVKYLKEQEKLLESQEEKQEEEEEEEKEELEASTDDSEVDETPEEESEEDEEKPKKDDAFKEIDNLTEEQLQALVDKIIEKDGVVPAHVFKKLKRKLSESQAEAKRTSDELQKLIEEGIKATPRPMQANKDEKDFTLDEIKELSYTDAETATAYLYERQKRLENEIKQREILQQVTEYDNNKLVDAEYKDVRNFIIQTEVDALKVQYPHASASEIVKAAKDNYAQAVLYFGSNNIDPALGLKDLAYKHGYKPKQAQQALAEQAKKSSINLEALAKNITEHQSGKGTKTVKGDDGIPTTIEEINGLSANKLFDLKTRLYNKAIKGLPENEKRNLTSEKVFWDYVDKIQQ